MDNTYFLNQSSILKLERTVGSLRIQFPQLEISIMSESLFFYMNNEFINQFNFKATSIGYIESVSVYGIGLREYLKNIEKNKMLFGFFKVKSITLRNDEFKEYLYLELYEEIESVYSKIIDKGECLSTINETSFVNWKNNEIKNKAGLREWNLYDFHLENNMVGEVVDSFRNTIWGIDAFVLKIDDFFYVPISRKGIKFISETEYSNMILLEILIKNESNMISGDFKTS